MITVLLIIGLIISLGINVAAFIIIRNFLKKMEVYEKWILDVKTNVTNTLELMHAIDRQGTFATSVNDKGNFEADDQVGQVFKELVSLIEELNDRTQ